MDIHAKQQFFFVWCGDGKQIPNTHLVYTSSRQFKQLIPPFKHQIENKFEEDENTFINLKTCELHAIP